MDAHGALLSSLFLRCDHFLSEGVNDYRRLVHFFIKSRYGKSLVAGDRNRPLMRPFLGRAWFFSASRFRFLDFLR